MSELTMFSLLSTPEAADAAQFRGSPTVLVDCRNPFANPAAPVGLSCQLYRAEAGLAGSPTLTQLVEVLQQADGAWAGRAVTGCLPTGGVVSANGGGEPPSQRRTLGWSGVEGIDARCRDRRQILTIVGDARRFPTAMHFAAYAGLAPGHPPLR